MALDGHEDASAKAGLNDAVVLDLLRPFREIPIVALRGAISLLRRPQYCPDAYVREYSRLEMDFRQAKWPGQGSGSTTSFSVRFDPSHQRPKPNFPAIHLGVSMRTRPPISLLDPKIAEELQNQLSRVGAFVSAARLWERVLSKRERQRLGDNLETCYAQLGTVGMWIKLRRVSPARAVADLARELGFLSDTDHRWLLRGIGNKKKTESELDHPRWQASTGELRWKGRVIRQVRVLSRPTNIHRILDAFNKANWCSRIKNPLRLGQQQLHQALRSLNKGLKGIRFHAQQGGAVIVYEPSHLTRRPVR